MSDLNVVELARRLENLIRTGTILAADYAAARVRVKSGDIETTWIPWLTARASSDRSWWAPEVGEQVLLLCPSGDPANGVALPAIFQTAHPAPANAATVHRVEYSDGAVIEYDRAAHHLKAVLPAGATTELVSTGGISIVGDVDVTGAIHASNDISTDANVIATANMTAGANIAAGGNVGAAGNITDAGGSMADMRTIYDGHDHNDPQGGTVGAANQKMS